MPGDGGGGTLDRLRVQAGPQKDQESIRGLDVSAPNPGTQGRGGAGDGIQSPMVGDLINQVLVM